VPKGPRYAIAVGATTREIPLARRAERWHWHDGGARPSMTPCRRNSAAPALPRSSRPPQACGFLEGRFQRGVGSWCALAPWAGRSSGGGPRERSLIRRRLSGRRVHPAGGPSFSRSWTSQRADDGSCRVVLAPGVPGRSVPLKGREPRLSAPGCSPSPQPRPAQLPETWGANTATQVRPEESDRAKGSLLWRTTCQSASHAPEKESDLRRGLRPE